MADLSQLFQYAPTTAGYFTGQNQANDFQKGQLFNQELAQRIALEAAKEQREAELFPERKRGLVLQNQGLEAEIPGKQAQSKKLGIDATTAEATQESDIAAKKAKNDKEIADADFEKMKNGQEMLMRMGAQLESVPPMFRKQALADFMQQSGMNPNAKHLQALLAVDPTKMPAMAASLAQRLGDQMMAMNPAARASIQSAQIHANASKYTADKHYASATEAARISSEGRVSAAQAKAAIAQDFMATLMSGKAPPANMALTAKVKSELAKRKADAEKDPEKKTSLLDEAQFWQDRADEAEAFAVRLKGAASEGRPGLTTGEDGSTTIAPRTSKPALGAKPKEGTAENPIVIK